MTKQEVIKLQIQLAELGFYKGRIDGIEGPKTTAAYDAYWATRPRQSEVPIITPDPAMPWWVSKGIWGALLVLLSLPLRLMFGIEYEPAEAIEVVMPIIEQIPNMMTAVGGFLAWWGRKNAKAPVDPTLLADIGGRPIRIGVRHFPLPSRSEAEYRDYRGGFSD